MTPIEDTSETKLTGGKIFWDSSAWFTVLGASQSTTLERSSENFGEGWDLNPGTLGEKLERYLCAMQWQDGNR